MLFLLHPQCIGCGQNNLLTLKILECVKIETLTQLPQLNKESTFCDKSKQFITYTEFGAWSKYLFMFLKDKTKDHFFSR